MLKTWHYIGISALLLLLFGFFLFKDKLISLLQKNRPPVTDPQTPDSGSVVDVNKILKQGVYNSKEVELLQTWLGGLVVDGDFGPLTEARLMQIKGVKEVTLSTYPSLPNVHNEAADNSDGNSHWYDFLPFNYVFDQWM